jgi:hypothetical protein
LINLTGEGEKLIGLDRIEELDSVEAENGDDQEGKAPEVAETAES